MQQLARIYVPINKEKPFDLNIEGQKNNTVQHWEWSRNEATSGDLTG